MSRSFISALAIGFALTSCNLNSQQKENFSNQKESFIGKWKLSPLSENEDSDSFSIPLLKEFDLNADSSTQIVMVDSGKIKNIKATWLWNSENNLVNNDIQMNYKPGNNHTHIWTLTIGHKDGKVTLRNGRTLVYEKQN